MTGARWVGAVFGHWRPSWLFQSALIGQISVFVYIQKRPTSVSATIQQYYILIFYVHRKINFCVLYVSGHWASDACHWSVDDVPAPQIRWHRIAHSYHPANHISRAVGSDPLIGSLGLLLHCQRQSAFALLGKGSFIYYVITFLGIFLIQFPP